MQTFWLRLSIRPPPASSFTTFRNFDPLRRTIPKRLRSQPIFIGNLHHHYPRPCLERKPVFCRRIDETCVHARLHRVCHNSVARLYSNQAGRPALIFARRPQLAPLTSLIMAFFRNKCTFLGLASLTVKRQPWTHTILSRVSGAAAQVLLQLCPQDH